MRLRNGHLHARVPRSALLGAVSRLGSVQAQVMSAAELALWARVDGLERDAVQRELWETRALVKTWSMRATLHLLPSPELAMWQRVPRLDERYLRTAWLSHFGLSAAQWEGLTEAVGDALEGTTLTREELVDAVEGLIGSRAIAEKLRHSWGLMLKPAAFRCRLCFAPSQGAGVRFTNPAGWLATSLDVDVEYASREVTRRFLGTYGPVTREVFAQWLGIPLTRAGLLIAGLGSEAALVDVEGTRAWMLSRDLNGVQCNRNVASVRLLPAFDQYVLTASRDAAHFLPGALRARVYRPQGWLSPVLLVDGRMEGTWKCRRSGRSLLMEIEPFDRIPASVRRLADAEAESLAGFLGLGPQITWQDPT